MGWLRGQFIDIIEWIDNTNDTIAYRFERQDNEIKQGAKLVVRPGQKAVFVNEGQVADEFDPGTYELYTRNLPLLSTLKGWKYGFESPFKAEVYFFSTRVFTNLKWGTANPIIVRDAELGPVRLRAFGTYSMRVLDPRALLENLISTDGLFQIDEVSDHLRNIIVPSVTSWVAGSGIALLDLATHYRQMSDRACTAIGPELEPLGIQLAQLIIENISLPPDVEEALDKRSSMGILGNMQQYAQYQAANAVETAANQPGGGNPGLDAGLGLAMGQQLMNSMNAQPVPNVPSPPTQTQWYIARDNQKLGPFPLNQLLSNGLAPQTLVWREGMNSWLFASEVVELQSLFPSAPPPPPPLAQDRVQWHIAQNGQQVGPFNLEQLQQQKLSPQTLVWKEGMGNWQKAENVAELSGVLASTPPGLPTTDESPTVPPPELAQWFIFRSGNALGPFTLTQLREQGVSGRTNLRREGETEWTRARDIADEPLQALLTSLE
ncbi:MAG: SPFH domain-containing protein [Cyanobacteriota bacterium]|nr:SPFH domain-containing protein [Cyanobacteriota bacterium]